MSSSSPFLLPAPCLRHYFGKTETQESALFHGGTMAHCFPGKGELIPILYGNGSTLPPASSERQRQLTAPAQRDPFVRVPNGDPGFM